MKKWLLVLIFVAMIGWAVYDTMLKTEDSTAEQEPAVTKEKTTETAKQHPESEKVGLNVGDQAPDFELDTLDGKTVKLSDFRGKRVMVNFWATWCPPCRAEMPDVQTFHEKQDVTVLAVNLTETEKSNENITDFVKEYELTFPILLDKQIKVAGLYQIQPIPTSYMIDSKGIIRYKALGALQYEWMVAELDKMQ